MKTQKTSEAPGAFSNVDRQPVRDPNHEVSGQGMGAELHWQSWGETSWDSDFHTVSLTDPTIFYV